MKKKNVINLIKYHTEKNEIQFRNEAIEIARSFDRSGDNQLSEYIMSLLSTGNTFIPQEGVEGFTSSFFRRVEVENNPLYLPEIIKSDIEGIINAVNHKVGINKFLFEGAPGTGKTESVKQIARLLNRTLYMIEFSELIDSKLGQTAKNIVSVFAELNRISYPERLIVLFDEIDAIALDRVNSNDSREMGRVTSTILKELDKLDEDIVLIATTNLFEKFDKALTRRFDATINFNRYSQEDLIEIAEATLLSFQKKFNIGRDLKLFRKVIKNMNPTPFPGEMSNLIRTSIAFSDPNNEFDYLRRLVKYAVKDPLDLKELRGKGFTVREIEILTGVSKSQVSRELKEEGK